MLLAYSLPDASRWTATPARQQAGVKNKTVVANLKKNL
jgi:hypothetical protein